MNEQFNKRKRFMFIAGPIILLIALIGVTYSFFNYTRTGAANTIRTGRIYFYSEQNNTLNLTNVFPIKSADAASANLNSVTVGIVGDTTYTDGEEFEITITDVNNELNDKKIPINYIATYTAATGETIGSSSSTYWTSRDAKDANIYTLNANEPVRDGKQILVGYIKNGQTGINGILTIKAYVNGDRIAISDTYQLGDAYELNLEEASACVSYLTSVGYNNELEEGETLSLL